MVKDDKQVVGEPETVLPKGDRKVAEVPVPVSVPVFSLECLRRDCARLFGVSASTFDGAVFGLKGEFAVADIHNKIKTWQNRRVLPATNKGGK